MSVGGFLAGNYPGAVKRDGYFFGTYPKDVLMFPERLQAASVRTMAIHGHGYFKPGTGLSQGFDVWKIVPNLKRLGLLTPRVREAFEKIGVLQFEHMPDSTQDETVTLPPDLAAFFGSIGHTAPVSAVG